MRHSGPNSEVASAANRLQGTECHFSNNRSNPVRNGKVLADRSLGELRQFSIVIVRGGVSRFWESLREDKSGRHADKKTFHNYNMVL